MELKDHFRKKILAERKNFDEARYIIANNDIIDKVSDFLNSSCNKKTNSAGKKSKLIVGLFWPLKGEPDLLKFVLDIRFTTSIPKIRAERMDYVKYEMGSELEISILSKLKQPVNNTKIIPNIAFLTGLGFSLRGHRLGFGMGQYDKYFARIENDIIKIGVCYHENLYEHLPYEYHDVKMDYIITDKTIICLNKKIV